MRRAAGLAIALALCVFAQSSRDSYRAAYRAWREADPPLELDAAMGGAALAERAGKAAMLAANYGAERTGFLRELPADDEQASIWLENAAPAEVLPDSPQPEQYVAAQDASVSRNIDVFANDTDKGIQRLRQALEHERAALAALSDAMAERQKASLATRETAQAVEQARMKALAEDRDLLAGLQQINGQLDRETAAWSQYYGNLADSAQSAAPAAQPGQPAQPGQQPGGISGNSAEPPPASGAPDAAAPRVSPPEMRPLFSSITPVPLPRYVGAWTFPASNGLYHGAQPEFIDLLVNEENGAAKGTLVGRFKLPPGSKDDPVLRVDFAGDFKNTRNQKFDATTSDGATGTIELIPGPAFNLLEVNLQIEPRPGKIHQANIVLLKK